MSKDPQIKTLRLKPDVIDKVNRLAEEDNRTFSNMVETILLKYKPNGFESMT
ncbi:hypothetical protein [Flagellimonas iocasae]|uniref:CopG family transcriptional regulator n=1 Tax=Flagellimonas iocasae TaxID=2055905 RepID=A0ABW4XYF6_9FLAO